MYEFFKSYKPRDEARFIVRTARSIIDDYLAQGLKLTLRQLYYQFVSRDLIPNSERSYKRLGSIIANARQGGLLDWDAIEDRVRTPKSPPEYDDLEDLIEAAFASYRLPRLEGQHTYVELWVEKDALAGVLAPIARKHHITLMVNRGYSSVSAMKESADRIREQCQKHSIEDALILYLGDLDPSGEDMVRDIRERLDMFLNEGVLFHIRNGDVIAEDEEERQARKSYIQLGVEKLALTMEQVEEYDPPPNPAKRSDSRARAFIQKYGASSWEVDALPPQVLREIIVNRLDEILDAEAMQTVMDREDEDKKRLRAALEAM